MAALLHGFRRTMLQQRRDTVVDRLELDTLIRVGGQAVQPDRHATPRAVRAGAPEVRWGWNFPMKDRRVPAPALQRLHSTPGLITDQQIGSPLFVL